MSRGSGCLLLLVLASACSSLPPAPPVLPVLPDTSIGMVSLGRTRLPIEVTAKSPKTGPVVFRQTWEGDWWDSAVPTFFDPRLAVGSLLSPYVGLAFSLSFLQAGGDIRVFPLGVETSWPLLLSCGARIETLRSLAEHGAGNWDARLAVALLPRVSERVQLMLGTAASYGAWNFRLLVPRALVHNETDSFFGSVLLIERRETRVEALLGVVFPVAWHLRAFITLEPFTIVNHGTPRVDCVFCVEDLAVTSLEAKRGLAFQLGLVF